MNAEFNFSRWYPWEKTSEINLLEKESWIKSGRRNCTYSFVLEIQNGKMTNRKKRHLKHRVKKSKEGHL